jgi:nucleoside-diphosphate-sugar epimerase
MKVLVTGGAGKVGVWVVRELIARGHEVTAAGRTHGRTLEGARYEVLDCTDLEATRRIVGEHDTVIHLAAIPSPGRTPSCEIFRINCLGSYHIYEACAEAGIRKIAVASSINALGMYFGVKLLPVRYFPIDEEHPTLLSDPYSFSKNVLDQMAEYFWNKDGISSVSIRIPAVIMPPPDGSRLRPRDSQDAETSFQIRNYWTWVDARDSARAFALGVEADYEGAHTLFINDRVNCLRMPSRELAARFYPEVTDWREPVEADEALVSCRRAKQILGWQPVFVTEK